MKKSPLQIVLPKPRYEDMISINIGNDEYVKVNFSKLVSYSDYVRANYKYSEATNGIQHDIDKLMREENIKPAVIKAFLELIEEEKVDLPKEYFVSFYRVIEYFEVNNMKDELDLNKNPSLLDDIDIALELLIEASQPTNKREYETAFIYKIEGMLVKRISEIICEDQLSEVETSSLYRIFEGSLKEGTLNQDLLSDFIIKSIDKRFIFLKLIDLDKMREEKVETFIKFLTEMEEEDENLSRYLEYMGFNLSFVSKLLNKKRKLEKTNALTEDKLNEAEQETARAKEENDAILAENKELRKELERKNDEIARIRAAEKEKKEKEKKEKEEKEKKEVKLDKSHTKSEKKQSAHSIIVGGRDGYNQLGKNPNDKSRSMISPPQNSPLDPSSLLSYSIYYYHSVVVRSNGSLRGIGYNKDGRIISSLTKTTISEFIDFSIKDDSGHQLAPVSAVCSDYGTLYMVSRSSRNGKQLVYCDWGINGGNPVFLDIGNQEPVALFGGYFHAAAINKEGEVIFINLNSVRNSPKSIICGNRLPGGEKASSVACMTNSVFVLSSKGRVFISSIERGSSSLQFSSVSELEGEEIVSLSGTHSHCLAVSKDGRVFGRGPNSHGQLGLGEGQSSTSSFTAIPSLGGYKIRAAYAGCLHSLFETREGKILSCGYNYYGELLLSSGPGCDVYSPRETTITSGATFCIAGYYLSAVFIGGEPPPNTPNRRIEYH